VSLSFTNSPINLASETSRRNAAALGVLKARTLPPGYSARRSAAHPQGGTLLLRPSSAPILFEAGYPRGPLGCAGPGRSMGPPLLHRMSEDTFAVVDALLDSLASWRPTTVEGAAGNLSQRTCGRTSG
jgi:hypothetical protein